MTVVLPETATGHLALAALENLKSFVEWADVIAVGPGIGQENETGKLLEKILACGKPLVIDADAINLIAAQSLTNKLPKHAILTPHPGEFARLTGSTAESQFDRIFAARNFSPTARRCVACEGFRSSHCGTLGKSIHKPRAEIPVLRRRGSGDILTGIIGAFLCQGIPPVAAAWGGAYMHGFAADIAADVIGEVSLLPSDVISHLPSAFAELEPES
jgi:hydroxyethylthiazole kinase-like uncharacterized protein yjeF